MYFSCATFSLEEYDDMLEWHVYIGSILELHVFIFEKYIEFRTRELGCYIVMAFIKTTSEFLKKPAFIIENGKSVFIFFCEIKCRLISNGIWRERYFYLPFSYYVSFFCFPEQCMCFHLVYDVNDID